MSFMCVDSQCIFYEFLCRCIIFSPFFFSDWSQRCQALLGNLLRQVVSNTLVFAFLTKVCMTAII